MKGANGVLIEKIADSTMAELLDKAMRAKRNKNDIFTPYTRQLGIKQMMSSQNCTIIQGR